MHIRFERTAPRFRLSPFLPEFLLNLGRKVFYYGSQILCVLMSLLLLCQPSVSVSCYQVIPGFGAKEIAFNLVRIV